MRLLLVGLMLSISTSVALADTDEHVYPPTGVTSTPNAQDPDAVLPPFLLHVAAHGARPHDPDAVLEPSGRSGSPAPTHPDAVLPPHKTFAVNSTGIRLIDP